MKPPFYQAVIAVSTIAFTALGVGWFSLGPPSSRPGGSLAEMMTPWIGVAHAQEAPDDDDVEEDDDAGGDGVGEDDVGNDGAGGGDDVGGDDVGGDDVGGDDVGGDDVGGDDVGGDDGGAAGGDDDGPGGDDDGPGGDDGPGPGGAGDDDDRQSTVSRSPRSRDRELNDLPGGAGVRGLSAESGQTIRDGDRDVAGPASLPDGVDVDFEGRWVRTGEILALEADPTSLELARGLGFQVVERYRLTTLGLSIVELRVPRDVPTRTALLRVRQADPDTAYDFIHLYLPTQTAPLTVAQAAGARQSAPRAPARATAGAAASGLSIGIVDTAIDAGHPALSRTRILQANFLTRDARATAGTANSHGTAVASILATRTALAPAGASRIYAANVVGKSPRGGAELASADSVVRALDWLAQQGSPIANVSLAGPPNTLVEDAVRRAQARGMIIVAAVGNDGPAAPPLYPAAYEGVIGVTAVDNTGAVYRRAGRGAHVDIAAQGVGVQVAAPGNRTVQMSGTSFAAPLVAAALAQDHRRPDPASARSAIDRLLGRVSDAGEKGRDPVYGSGVLQNTETPR